ncbi:MAG TPA: hypothetical protein DEA22_02335 [Blastocatellia bacterium]|nr:hypothetical protein [Blastocatellia bacterium]
MKSEFLQFFTNKIRTVKRRFTSKKRLLFSLLFGGLFYEKDSFPFGRRYGFGYRGRGTGKNAGFLRHMETRYGSIKTR